jgi:Secretion system C-terminal sorting domain/Cohesin domain
MEMKFYKKTITILMMALAIFTTTKVSAQNQGFTTDTIKWANATTVTVNFKSKGFSNVIGFQGTIKWDKNTLQWVSQVGNSSFGAANFSFNSANAVSQGVLTYVYGDAAANHTVADGTTIMSITFNVINNPVSTYNDNSICFANTPTSIGIDTAADVAGLSDLATLNSPSLERHTCGLVSFARPPVLTYAGGNVTDSITNRPAGCTYQWTVGGNPVAGTNISSYNSSALGTVCLTITYPNSNSVNCLSTVLPLKLTSFTGKNIENKNQLLWATATESNTNNFEIERSTNGVNFTNIATQKAMGNSVTTQHYAYIDAEIANNSVLYYRLKMNDNNGKFTYSSVVKIDKNNKTVYAIYPSPTKGEVSLDFYSKNNNTITVTLVNAQGKTITQQSFEATKGYNVYHLNLNKTGALINGVYFVKIKGTDGEEVRKVIVDAK